MTISATTNLSEYAFKLAAKTSYAHYRPWDKRIMISAFFAIIVLYGLAVTLNVCSGSGAYNYIGHFAFLVLVAVTIWEIRRRKSIASSIQNGKLRLGDINLTLDPQGYKLSKPGYQLVIGWELVDDAVESQHGILVLMGPGEFFLAPASAFKDPASQSQALAQIKSWIALAKAQSADQI